MPFIAQPLSVNLDINSLSSKSSSKFAFVRKCSMKLCSMGWQQVFIDGNVAASRMPMVLQRCVVEVRFRNWRVHPHR